MSTISVIPFAVAVQGQQVDSFLSADVIDIQPAGIAVKSGTISLLDPSQDFGLDLGPPLRNALAAASEITALLGTYSGSFSIHTRVPVPENASYPMLVISSDILLTDEDGLISRRPVVTRDIAVYGLQSSDYRAVERIGYFVRELFHRKRASIDPFGYRVLDIVASGPQVAPASDEEFVGRVVTLTIRLEELV